MASGVILPHREVPFSVANFNALRVGAPLRTAKETQSLVLLEQGGEGWRIRCAGRRAPEPHHGTVFDGKHRLEIAHVHSLMISACSAPLRLSSWMISI